MTKTLHSWDLIGFFPDGGGSIGSTVYYRGETQHRHIVHLNYYISNRHVVTPKSEHAMILAVN